ncbi:MAG: YihY/virulence factor BrkB family protein [Dorea sp.]|nr:YihY/virulence factor BrkB family protein [Dorea sp.]
MSKLTKIYHNVSDVPATVTDDHVAAYAAQAAYFFMLSIVPIILLLLLIVRFTPITKADVMTGVITLFPSSVDSLITSVVNQVYNQSMSVIPITVFVALWSAGKGMLALTSGLNCIYKCRETRNYFFLRIKATIYTLIFLCIMIFILIISVFGPTVYHYLSGLIPFWNNTAAAKLLEIRTIMSPIIIVCFILLIYKVLPNRKGKLLYQIPGAIFGTVGWMAVSWGITVYLDVFTGFSTMYGSMTTIILIMLWMYFCMYAVLLGAELNMVLHVKFYPNKEGV